MIAVIGDFMIDHYIWGKSSRISPEALVPVVEVTKEEDRLGGAGNVVSNLLALNADVLPITVLGKNYKRILNLLQEKNLNCNYIFIDNNRALVRIALTTDTSALTAIGNDYGFEQIFSRQVEALAKKGDVLITISTSGNSKNVINAIKSAQKIGCKIITLTGKDGGEMANTGDTNIIIPSNNTPRIQEMHIMVGHIIYLVIDNCLD